MNTRIISAITVATTIWVPPLSSQPASVPQDVLVPAVQAVVSHHGFDSPGLSAFVSGVIPGAPAPDREKWRKQIALATGMPEVANAVAVQCQDPDDHRTCSIAGHDALVDIVKVDQRGENATVLVGLRYMTPQIERQPITHRVWKVSLSRGGAGWDVTDLDLEATS